MNGRAVVFERAEKEAAEAKAAELNEQAAVGVAARPLLTSLSVDELTDAERARSLLPAGTTLTQAAAFLAQHHQPIVPIRLSDAIDEFVEMKRTQAKNRALTTDILQAVLDTLPKEPGVALTIDLTPAVSKKWIFKPDLQPRTQRDRHDHLRRLCEYLVQTRRLLENPLTHIPRPKVQFGPPAILSIDAIQRLLDAAWTDPEGPSMVPFFAMAVFSGVRPFELRRAHKDHWFLDDDTGLFEVHGPKGVWRTVELLPNLTAILRECQARELPLAFFSKRKFDRIRRDAGVFAEWESDVLRHSSASYLYAAHHDVRWLEANYGNTERVLFRHYIRRGVRKTDGLAFLNLTISWGLPRRSAAPLMAM